MKPMPRPVFLAAGAYTVSLGPGRREFNPRTARPGLDPYIRSAGEAVLAQVDAFFQQQLAAPEPPVLSAEDMEEVALTPEMQHCD